MNPVIIWWRDSCITPTIWAFQYVHVPVILHDIGLGLRLMLSCCWSSSLNPLFTETIEIKAPPTAAEGDAQRRFEKGTKLLDAKTTVWLRHNRSTELEYFQRILEKPKYVRSPPTLNSLKRRVQCLHRSPEMMKRMDEALLRWSFGGRRWSCGDSNSGPAKAPIDFLHA